MSVTATQTLTQQTVTVTGTPVENNVTVTVSNARGVAGADGATGADGAAGEAGPTGPAGPDASVTSVNVQAALTADPIGAREAIHAPSFINVLDYGATGDGATDDRVAIQAAITALEASTTINTLYFPRGTYVLDSSVADANTHTASYRCLILGTADLAGRDILLLGEPGATLRQTLGTQRTHLLVANASFQSLSVEGLRFEKDSTPLAATAGEPNGNDAVSLVRVDSREVEHVSFLACTFYNTHGAVFAYGSNHNVRGKLKRFNVLNCQVLNPWGANTVDSGASFGGGQQFYLSPWIGVATYGGTLFEGGSADLTADAFAPGGKLKDAAHFGAPMRLVFTNNVVKRHGVEVVYMTATHNYLGTTSAAGFTVPVNDGVTTATFVHDAATASSGPGTFTAGMNINIQAVGRFEVTDYNAGTRTVTIVDNGLAGNLDAGVSAGTAAKFIYEDELNGATLHIAGNDIDGTLPTGAHSASAAFGIVASVRGEVSGNTIRGCDVGIYNYDVIATPTYDQARGLIISGNHITTRENSAAAITAYGISLRTDDAAVEGNTVVIPNPTKTTGVWVNGDRSRLDNNLVISLTAAANGYADAERVVGIGVGNQSTATIATGNSTVGCDVGIGSGQSGQSLPLTIYSHTSVSDVLAIDKQAAVVMPKTGAETSPQFAATLSANQSHAGAGYEKVRFNTEEYDTAAAYDNATNYRFQPLVAGRYLVTVTIAFENISSGSTIAVQVRKAGSVSKTKTVASENVNPTGNYTRSASLQIAMNGSSDYLEVYAYQNTGTRNILGGETVSSFQASLLP